MEEGGFQHQRMVKRRLMKAQCSAEARRLHIVYFLNRTGYNEDPHLIRVHHLSKLGVRLRDVKRWLGELRGKDMPESFAWSYKMRYRTGYVWQDLVDDDLIIPISDNEYVLNGSQISSTIIKNIEFSYSNEIKNPMQKDQTSPHETSSKELDNQSPSESSTLFDSETSTLTDGMNSRNDEVCLKNSDKTLNREKYSAPSRPTPNSNRTTTTQKKKKRVKINEEKIIITASTPPNKMSSISDHYKTSEITKSKNCANGALFKNLITCGGVDTNDSAVVMTNRKKNGAFLDICSNHEKNVHAAAATRKREIKPQTMIVGAPNRTPNQWNNSKSSDGVKNSRNKKGQFREQRTPSGAKKPLSRPNCSQCGKPFKPERLHAHMQSCKGMRTASNPKTSAAADKPSQVSTENRHQNNSVSDYFLTQ